MPTLRRCHVASAIDTLRAHRLARTGRLRGNAKAESGGSLDEPPPRQVIHLEKSPHIISMSLRSDTR
jgi:hypothetical protein